MALESPITYISDLVSTNPAAGDPKAQGDDHLRGIKVALKTTFPNVSGAVTPTHTVLNYMVGVTSAVQTQLDAKGAIAGQTWTGTHDFSGATAINVPTATAGDSSNKAASTAFAAALAFSSALPNQTGNSGKSIITNGTSPSWGVSSVVGGGTGVATITGLVKGNGTSAFSAAVAGTDYQAVLVSATNIKTINGSTILGSGDLTVTSSAGDHCVSVYGGSNGHGSTNTKIRRYTTTLISTGTAITYADSAANGGSFTINATGFYECHIRDRYNSSTPIFGISVNSNQLTTSIDSITKANEFGFTFATTSLNYALTRVLYLQSGDVVRAHTDGTAAGGNDAMFSIRKVGL